MLERVYAFLAIVWLAYIMFFGCICSAHAHNLFCGAEFIHAFACVFVCTYATHFISEIAVYIIHGAKIVLSHIIT